ncbi:ABC transporter permease [Heyndrickxia coagulans]|uniref:ABC transporter permease n=1 Tax=Heyndrickxia coagulans TaxID=1398 RepID=UPI002EAC4B8E|nr:ABC transporter permease [Heyndrickxia coagulans]
MTINGLIYRNFKKNLPHYALYIFALAFSAALYFAFVTLQYTPSLDEVKSSVKGLAALKVASVLLIVIVAVFLFYANHLFIKRRSKEIGLFQLVGMTKREVFRILGTENFLLYYGSLFAGIFFGFAASRLLMMLLLRIIQVKTKVSLYFSIQAFGQTILVFSIIFVLILLINSIFIKRQTILSLFRTVSSTEDRAARMSKAGLVLGITGFVCIGAGYYISSKLFNGDFRTVRALFTAMGTILALVILGTYLFFKTSVRFVFYLIRKKKGGYLNIRDVMSLSAIMFRIRSNAVLLTIITTVSALAIGLLSLSYITFYSAEDTAHNVAAADFSFIKTNEAKQFTKRLNENRIAYEKEEIAVVRVTADLSSLFDKKTKDLKFDTGAVPIAVVSDAAVKRFDVKPGQAVFSGYPDALAKFMPMKSEGMIDLTGKRKTARLRIVALRKDQILSNYFSGSMPVLVTDDAFFQDLKKDTDPKIQLDSKRFTGINLKKEEDLGKADRLFQSLHFPSDSFAYSSPEIIKVQKENMGVAMFIVGFLGLTFLVTSGCILYFKQMEESEEEKPSYTILRKLGFTTQDLTKGIRIKQLYNFGIPLLLGLSHSYFAVKSGWFFFGSSLWTPMLIVMVLYTLLYSVFALLSVEGFKKAIRDSL